MSERIDNIILDIAHDGVQVHEDALSMRPCNIITVNNFGEISPFTSDIDVKGKDNIILCNTTKMNEDLFDLLNTIVKINGSATTCKMVFTAIKYSQELIDTDDLHTLCDILDLINGNN